jgi:hypothetical protein
MSDQQATLVDLLLETGRAHHQAFLATDGVDPGWPQWYADHMVPRLRDRLGAVITADRVAAWLERADQEHRRQGAGVPWADFYAARFPLDP